MKRAHLFRALGLAIGVGLARAALAAEKRRGLMPGSAGVSPASSCSVISR
jgi:hypothetical protein